MPKPIECPHCLQTDFIKALDPHDWEADVEPCKKGFTHWCLYCLNMNWDDGGDPAPADEMYHLSVSDDGTVTKLPRPNAVRAGGAFVDMNQRAQGLRVEIDEAEMAVTDKTHKIPELMGRMGAAAAKAVQALADAAFASGIAADQMNAFGQACHSAGIGKTVECAVDSSGEHQMTVFAAEEITAGQVIYLDDDGKARVCKAAESEGEIDDLEPGSVAFLPEGWKLTALPDGTDEDEFEDDDDYLPDADEVEDTFSEAFEAARLKAGGIPTEGGFRMPGQDAEASLMGRVAVWVFKAGAASCAGGCIWWAVKQLLKAAL